ncbi:hypothetical protein MHU86_12282 [Fragilaria crotonensis]|nr:hypothetical protein MHU86_12282 [Fragilaria crotonensis]
MDEPTERGHDPQRFVLRRCGFPEGKPDRPMYEDEGGNPSSKWIEEGGKPDAPAPLTDEERSESKRDSMAGPPNIRGVGAELTVEEFPRPSQTSAYQPTTLIGRDNCSPARQKTTWATQTETRGKNRLVSKWRSEQLRYMVWGESTVLCLQHY